VFLVETNLIQTVRYMAFVAEVSTVCLCFGLSLSFNKRLYEIGRSLSFCLPKYPA